MEITTTYGKLEETAVFGIFGGRVPYVQNSCLPYLIENVGAVSIPFVYCRPLQPHVSYCLPSSKRLKPFGYLPFSRFPCPSSLSEKPACPLLKPFESCGSPPPRSPASPPSPPQSECFMMGRPYSSLRYQQLLGYQECFCTNRSRRTIIFQHVSLSSAIDWRAIFLGADDASTRNIRCQVTSSMDD